MPTADNDQLETALAAVAEALAMMPPDEWQRMCAEEAADIVAVHEYFETFGFPDTFPPERWLGRQIIDALAAKYPLLVDNEQLQ